MFGRGGSAGPILAAGLLVVSSVGLAFSLPKRQEQPLLTVNNPVFDIGVVAPRTVVPVAFRFSNRSSEPVHLLGAPSLVCMDYGCPKVKGLPATVPPWSDFTLEIDYPVGDEGEMDVPVLLYTDCPTSIEFPLRIKASVANAIK